MNRPTSRQTVLTLSFIVTVLPTAAHATSPWNQLGSDLDGHYLNGRLGSSVTVSANGVRVASGEPYSDGATGLWAGIVWVYDWNGQEWSVIGSINGETEGSHSGWSASLSSDGTVLAVGAPGNTVPTPAGYVRIYEHDGTEWSLRGTQVDGEAANDVSGWSVSLSGNGSRVAIGASLNDGNGIDSGHVRVFEWDGMTSTWFQMGTDIDGEAAGDESGYSVSLSGTGDRLAVGAHLNDGNGDASGHVRIFEWDGFDWSQIGTDIDGESVGDESGYAVALSDDGNRVVIGAPNNDGNGDSSGHVRVYEWDAGGWVQLGADIDGDSALDFSGSSVSFSDDGERLAIGATGDSGIGPFAGHVRVFEWNGLEWSQFGTDIDGEFTNDQFGWSVGLSADGGRVAAGAPENNVGAGHVRVFRNPFEIFSDGFESGGTGAWSATMP